MQGINRVNSHEWQSKRGKKTANVPSILHALFVYCWKSQPLMKVSRGFFSFFLSFFPNYNWFTYFKGAQTEALISWDQSQKRRSEGEKVQETRVNCNLPSHPLPPPSLARSHLHILGHRPHRCICLLRLGYRGLGVSFLLTSGVQLKFWEGPATYIS